MTILLRQKPLPQVVRQIVQRDNGAWFDPEDMSTMYQDAAGTTPVTAVEQPVGLMLDKSRGMMLGSELVTNGEFSNGTAGWAATNGAFAVVGGRAEITGARGFYPRLTQAITTTAGRWYKVSVPYEKGTYTGSVYMNFGSDVTSNAASGTLTGYFLAGSASAAITVGEYSEVATGTVYFDNISVRELYGYHATQAITASRPTLSARYNQLTNTDSFIGWVHSNVSTTSNYGTDPNGQQTATLLTNKAGSLAFLRLPDGLVASVKTFSCLVKQSSTGWVRLVIANHPSGVNAAGCYFNTTTCELGSIALYGTGYTLIGTPKVRAIVDDWVSISITVSGPPEQMQPVFSIAAADGNTVSPVGATCQICWPDLRLGVSAGVYQRVNTATDYDTVGFPKYIKAEGVDDHFVLPYLRLYNNASCSIIASHSSSSQAANGVIVSEASSTDADTKYLPYRQLASAGNVDSYIAADNAAVILDSTGAAYSGTKENIIESIIDSGTSIETYRSGVLLSNEPYTRSATLTLNNTTLFGSVSTTNTNFLNTKLYGLIITKSNLSARDRSLCETYLKSKVQVLQV